MTRQETSPGERAPDDPRRIDDAVRRAVREAVLTHARMGRAICTWKDGRVVWLQPDEVFALFANEPHGGSGPLTE